MAFSRLSHGFSRVASVLARRFLHQEKQIDVYGLKINTIQTGEGPRCLLLLPGAIGSAWTDFSRQIRGLPALLPGFQIVAWDPPGCGKSSPHPRSVFCDLFLDDAHAAVDLMQKLHMEYFSVLGWNGGGTTALVMAGRFPQFIDKVVVWGSSAYFSFPELKRLDSYRGATTRDAFGTINKPLEQLYGQERYTQMWQKYVEKMSSIIKARDGDICKTEVDCIQAPSLILHGKHDPIISKDHANYLKKHIKQSTYFEFAEGSHDLHIKLDQQFNQTVSKFLLQKHYW